MIRCERSILCEPPQSLRRLLCRLSIAVAGLGASGCGPIAMAIHPVPTSCRASPSLAVRWISPDEPDERRQLALWCDAVGPAVRYEAPHRTPNEAATSLTVVVWNAGVGQGRIAELIGDVRAQYPASELVLLAQEVFRSGDVPGECAPDARRARRIGRRRHDEEVLAVARGLGLHAVYIPSMRNGEDCRSEPREDRGNAILSTLPLDNATAIELPVAQQRRVAVAASVRIGARDLWLASIHLDTSPFAHRRQARALAGGLKAIDAARALIVGGDFNGALPDPGIIEARRHFREISCGDEPTHNFPALRLDRLFREGAVTVEKCETSRRSYGSDHWPVIATIRVDAT